MDVFKDYLNGIEVIENRNRMKEVLTFIHERYPELGRRIAWNQPMFTHHGTFIIGFSVAKKHMAMTPEAAGIKQFAEDITKSGYDYTSMIIRIPWDGPFDYELLEKMIEFNIMDKAEVATFWRK